MKRRKIKRIVVVCFSIILLFVIYVEIVNRNTQNMTYRQKMLKAVYPALMWVSKLTGIKNKNMENEKSIAPNQSVYDLSITLNDSSSLPLSSLKGKKLLLVNTASNCGYTSQYEDLEKLSKLYADKLIVIAFPANDFKEQEKGTDEEIAQFCKVNFGISFPLAKKSSVIKSPDQNAVFRWLTHREQNGWNDQPPTWNFSKYLVNESGELIHYFDPGLSPLSKEIKSAVEK